MSRRRAYALGSLVAAIHLSFEIDDFCSKLSGLCLVLIFGIHANKKKEEGLFLEVPLLFYFLVSLRGLR